MGFEYDELANNLIHHAYASQVEDLLWYATSHHQTSISPIPVVFSPPCGVAPALTGGCGAGRDGRLLGILGLEDDEGRVVGMGGFWRTGAGLEGVVRARELLPLLLLLGVDLEGPVGAVEDKDFTGGEGGSSSSSSSSPNEVEEEEPPPDSDAANALRGDNTLAAIFRALASSSSSASTINK